MTVRLALALALIAPMPALAQVSHQQHIEQDGSRTLVHEVLIPAKATAVWQAVATPEGWRGWAAPFAHAEASDPDLVETSYDPAATPGNPAHIQQRFLARLPGRLLAFRTVRTPPDFPHKAAFVRVTSFIELIPEGGATRVRLSGTGYPAGAAGDALLGFFTQGNRVSLDRLRRHFAEGPVDWRKER